MATPSRILIIAGSDSSGGAGIQADIKTVTMLGGYAMTAITALTAQNTCGVQGVETVPAGFVAEQISSCLSDIGVDAVKVGMVGSAETAVAIEEALKRVRVPIVFDPVMVATSGARLADEATRTAFERLMAAASVITPNLPELTALTGEACNNASSIEDAATSLAASHQCHVLAKGGHGDGDVLTDRLYAPSGLIEAYSDARIDTRHTHGTGCTLSSAIATLLGQGLPTEQAVRQARLFVRRAIENAPGFGDGSGPLGHQAVR